MRWPRAVVDRHHRSVGWLLFALALVVLHGPALVRHVIYALEPGVFNDDVRQQIFPFFRFSDNELFATDTLGDYILAGTPIGLRALYTAAALINDAAPLSKALPYLLLLVTMLAVVSAASAIGSRWSAFASASLLLGASLFLARMAGGLARGFAFPLLALGLAFLAAGRLRCLVALVPVAAGFYPPVAVLLGLASAFAVFLLPAAERGDLAGHSASRRFALLAGALLLTVLVALPPVLGLRGYGPMISPAMVREYPEAGPGGRYDAEDRPPFASFWTASVRAVARGLRPGGTPFGTLIARRLPMAGGGRRDTWRRSAVQYLVVAICLVGCASLAGRSAATRRTLMLAIAVFLAHVASRLATPYLFLPGRYLFYAVPLLTLVLLPAGAAEAARLLPSSARWRSPSWIAAATALALLAVFGGTGSSSAGLQRLVPDDDPLFAAVSGLPKGSLIAGWPTGPVNSVPYACRRQVLLSWELHQAFHTGFVAETRRRMRALIDATFATSPEPLLRLRDEFGVTHLIVHLPHLQGAPPTYFAPYGEWAAEAVRRADGREFLALRLVAAHAVFADDQDVILDLTTLAPTSLAAPAAGAPGSAATGAWEVSARPLA